MNADRLSRLVDEYLNNEEMIPESGYFFDANFSDIESMKISDDTFYPELKA
jgi:hypothetical protein